MRSFKINKNRIFPLLSKYNLPFVNEDFFIEELGGGDCQVIFKINTVKDFSLNNKTYEKYDFEKLNNKLNETIKTHTSINVTDQNLYDELIFLILYIGYSKSTIRQSNAFFGFDNNKLFNFMKLRKLILDSGGLKNVTLEFKSNLSDENSALTAEFANLDLEYFFLNHFLKSLSKLLNLNINDELLSESLSEERIISQIWETGLKVMEEEDKLRLKIEARGAFILKDFLIDNFEVKPSRAMLSFPQVKIIYPFYYEMGWRAQPDKKEKYKDQFKKEILANFA
ncbi:hypothetical protein [Pedobacter arcticus]|uniref:hypothetical protein n=1 Tax=Pedobacter arcticus TaxID=752140 RepID=UPI0002D4CC81|nr:hypothetical protein [Pedobacter arcticus]